MVDARIRVVPEMFFPPIAISVLAVAMVVLTIRYLRASGTLEPAAIPLADSYLRNQLKYLAALSLAIGTLGTLSHARSTFLQIAIAGTGYFCEKAMGPIADGLINLGCVDKGDSQTV